MKKYIITTLLLLSTQISTLKACDICGCGVGSYYLGILPEYQQRFMGLRYQYKTLRTHLGAHGENTPLTADEQYQSMEIWAGWNIGTHFRVLTFLPYNMNQSFNQLKNTSKNGIGDVALMGYYKLFEDKKVVKEKLMVQSLWVGAGVKVPTGMYDPNSENNRQGNPNNFQLGTASTDFTLNAAYDIRLQDIGLNINMNYKINTENKFKYQYGNKLSSNALIYFKYREANMSIAPNFGILYETAAKDVENRKYVNEVSGGHSLAALVGIEFNYKKISTGLNYQNIINQKLASNRAFAGNRVMAHLSFAF